MDVAVLTIRAYHTAWGHSHSGLWLPSENSSLLFKIKLPTQVPRMRRGKKEQLKDAEVLHVCIHGGIVGKATSLQLYVLGSFFSSLSFDLTIIPWRRWKLCCIPVFFLITIHMGESRIVSSQKTSFSGLPVSAHTKEQIWTIQKPPVPSIWTFLDTQKTLTSIASTRVPWKTPGAKSPLEQSARRRNKLIKLPN